MNKFLGSLAICTVFAVGSLSAQKETTTADLKVGKVISGETITKSDLTGKVVVIEYWGTK